MSVLLAALLAPFYAYVNPEVRTTYLSLGKIVEDRPMQVTAIGFGWDTGVLGRFYVKNWDVSSLTDRRADVHRHCLYHHEWGPAWQYDWKFNEEWKLRFDLTRSWTIYDGFNYPSRNNCYHWWEFGQALENPYVVPFYRLRYAFRTSDYFYAGFGVRKRIPIWQSWYATPSVTFEGGNAGNSRRMFGKNKYGDNWGYGQITSVTMRLETGWRFNEIFTAFIYVEQYEVIGDAARATNADSDYLCSHNDWTLGGIGMRMRF